MIDKVRRAEPTLFEVHCVRSVSKCDIAIHGLEEAARPRTKHGTSTASRIIARETAGLTKSAQLEASPRETGIDLAGLKTVAP